MKNPPYLGDLNFLTTQMFNRLLEVTGSREWRKVGIHVGLVSQARQGVGLVCETNVILSSCCNIWVQERDLHRNGFLQFNQSF